MSTDQDESPLVHCIYASAAVKDFSKKELQTLLAKARRNNARLQVTGMLLYHEQSFFQVLEGPEETINQLYQVIYNDKRHNRIIKLVQEPIQERAFDDWTMGYAKVSYRELQEIAGLNEFMSRRTSFLELKEGRARALLEAFKQGRWRQKLS